MEHVASKHTYYCVFGMVDGFKGRFWSFVSRGSQLLSPKIISHVLLAFLTMKESPALDQHTMSSETLSIILNVRSIKTGMLMLKGSISSQAGAAWSSISRGPSSDDDCATELVPGGAERNPPLCPCGLFSSPPLWRSMTYHQLTAKGVNGRRVVWWGGVRSAECGVRSGRCVRREHGHFIRNLEEH